MRWDHARVVVFGLLCRPEGPGRLLDDVAGALAAHEREHRREPGRWVTAGIRLRQPRSEEEHAELRELLAQRDDPLAPDRAPMVLEIGGRGSSRRAEGAEEAVCRALCPEEFHPGPCPVPWYAMTWGLQGENRAEKLLFRDLFPRHAGQRS